MPSRAELAGVERLALAVGVGPGAQAAAPVRPAQHRLQIRRPRRSSARRSVISPEHDLAGRAVDRDDVAFLDRRRRRP